MKGKAVALVLLLSLMAPLPGHAAAVDTLAEGAGVDIVLTREEANAASDEREGGRLEKVAVAAATGAAIGSIWPGPGTVLGLVAGGIYGFFFR